ncbi:MAG TPA: septal ring lytic transglycosylase RlpA family protein [Candidatus Limnocylindrales bacterium]|nr:septal ring lytic transglycosylase RlpA family protein [Candidatus Limnocylindrales bacterium]
MTPAWAALALSIIIALVPDPGTAAQAPDQAGSGMPAATQITAPASAALTFRVASMIDLMPEDAAGEPDLSFESIFGVALRRSAVSTERALSAPVDALPPRPLVEPGAPPPAIGGAAFQGKVVATWRYDPNVSWYGPGFYGNRTACGYAYTETIVGVAHRSLPCGTIVQFRWAGRVVSAPVIDRGPYVSGRIWDLSAGLCKRLNHCFTGPIEWRIP